MFLVWFLHSGGGELEDGSKDRILMTSKRSEHFRGSAQQLFSILDQLWADVIKRCVINVPGCVRVFICECWLLHIWGGKPKTRWAVKLLTMQGMLRVSTPGIFLSVASKQQQLMELQLWKGLGHCLIIYSLCFSKLFVFDVKTKSRDWVSVSDTELILMSFKENKHQESSTTLWHLFQKRLISLILPLKPAVMNRTVSKRKSGSCCTVSLGHVDENASEQFIVTSCNCVNLSKINKGLL